MPADLRGLPLDAGGKGSNIILKEQRGPPGACGGDDSVTKRSPTPDRASMGVQGMGTVKASGDAIPGGFLFMGTGVAPRTTPVGWGPPMGIPQGSWASSVMPSPGPEGIHLRKGGRRRTVLRSPGRRSMRRDIKQSVKPINKHQPRRCGS